MALGDAAFSKGDLMRRLALLEDEVRQLRAARRLESATIGEGGLRVKGGNITVQNDGSIIIEDGGDVIIAGGGDVRSEDFDGAMAGGDPGSTGWALGSDRLALLGALVVPVDFFNEFSSGNNFSINPTITVKTSITVPVPDWADEAGAIAMSMISAQNNSASSDSLNGRSRIDGIEGQLFNKTVAVGEVFDVTLGQTEIVNVSGRTSFEADIQVWTGANNWPADGANNAALSLLVVFRSAP